MRIAAAPRVMAGRTRQSADAALHWAPRASATKQHHTVPRSVLSQQLLPAAFHPRERPPASISHSKRYALCRRRECGVPSVGQNKRQYKNNKIARRRGGGKTVITLPPQLTLTLSSGRW